MALYTLAAFAAFLTAQVCCQTRLPLRSCCTPTYWRGWENDTMSGLTGRFWRDNEKRLTLVVRDNGGWQLLDENLSKNYTYFPEKGVCVKTNLQPYYAFRRCIERYSNVSYLGPYQDPNGTSDMWQATDLAGRRATMAYDEECMFSMFRLMSPDGSRELVSVTYPNRFSAHQIDPDVFDQIDTSGCYDVDDYAWSLNLARVVEDAVCYRDCGCTK